MTKHPEYVWQDKSGEDILLKNMDTTHILNTIKCLEGKGKSYIPEGFMGRSKQAWIEIFAQELLIRTCDNVKELITYEYQIF